MLGEHVVEDQHVAHAPVEAPRLAVYGAADGRQGLRLDRAAIAVVGLVRQVFLGDAAQQRIAQARLETAGMEEHAVVEPQALAGMRVALERRAPLPGAQVLVADPGMGDPVLSAERLDLGAAVGLERFAPGQAEAGAVVAHVEDAQALEALQQFVRQVAEHQPVGRHRGGAAFERRHLAMEHDVQRPVGGIGLLVMQEDRLVQRMLGGGVDLAADLAARRGTLLVVEQLRSEGGGGGAEALCRVDLEASQQQAASQIQVVVQGLALLADPVGQGQAGSLRLDQQRQGVALRRRAPHQRLAAARGEIARPGEAATGETGSCSFHRCSPWGTRVVRKRCSPPATCVSR
ncbi:Uncharacterised protein [Enterobacter cloacae]|nr:Uncharacterised protein [Enterobacter cloacae]